MTHRSGIEQLQELGAKYWKPFFTLVAAVLFVPNTLKQIGIPIEKIPGLSPLTSGSRLGYILIVIGVLLFIAIRFPKVAIIITRLFLGSPKIPPPAGRIFRGPRPYRNEDKDKFPGRQREIDDCWLNLEENTFFILEGESGCGKTSLLNAGLIPQARDKFRVVECRIADDPIGKLRAAFLQEPYRKPEQPIAPVLLSQAIDTAFESFATHSPFNRQPTEPLLLCIDQFEELFVTVKGETRLQVMTVLNEAIENGKLRVAICIRSDFSDLLMKLCRAVDKQQHSLNLGNYYGLRAFRSLQARAVLEKLLEPVHQGDPVKKQDVDDFVEALVHELLRPQRDERLCPDDEMTVLPVELQTIGMMLEEIGDSDFSLSRLKQSGGKTGLLRAYVDDAKNYVWRSTAVPGDDALLVLRQLISPARTKWAQTAESIHESLSVPTQQIENVLEAFTRKYLVNKLPLDVEAPNADGKMPGRYELMHEHLVHILMEAPQPILQKARDAEERLNFWTERTKDTFSTDSNGSRGSVTSRIISLFAQPIPMLESARLFRFASSKSSRRLLWRNLKGFAMRLAILTLILSLPLSGWAFWVTSDDYQIRVVLNEAPVAQAARGEEMAFEAVCKWAEALVKAGKLEQALEVADQTGQTGRHFYVLIYLAKTMTKAGKMMEANRALDDAKVFLENQLIGTTYYSDALYTLSLALYKANRRNEATNVAREYLKLPSDYADPIKRLMSMALFFYGMGEIDQANQQLEKGKAFVSDSAYRDTGKLDIASTLASIGRINECLSLVSTLDPPTRLETLFDIASELVADDKLEDATKIVNAAMADPSFEPATFEVQDAVFREHSVCYILIRIGRLDDAMRYVQSPISEQARIYQSSEACKALIERGKQNDARKFYEIAFATLQSMPDLDRRWVILSELANLLSQIDHDNKAKAVLIEALQHTAEINGDSQRSKALGNIAQGFAYLHLYRLARLTCDRCSSVDRLYVYSVMLSEFSKEQH